MNRLERQVIATLLLTTPAFFVAGISVGDGVRRATATTDPHLIEVPWSADKYDQIARLPLGNYYDESECWAIIPGGQNDQDGLMALLVKFDKLHEVNLIVGEIECAPAAPEDPKKCRISITSD